MSAGRPGWVREARESPLPREATALPTSGGTPEEHFSLGHLPVAVSREAADAAFRGLYAEHGPALLRLATGLTDGDHGRAEDLVQETMLRAWTHRNKLDIQHHSPRAWLATIVRRLAVDAHRARRARPRETELDEHVALAGSQQADASIDQVSVRAAIAALPGPQRQVLAEVFYRDRSVAETARILRIPPGTVKSRTYYALRALRNALDAHDAVA
jgi:RNA polymerase sigma-70 factor, ECF subfamily